VTIRSTAEKDFGIAVIHAVWKYTYINKQHCIHTRICAQQKHIHLFPFSTLTLFIGQQKGHLARKKLGVGLLVFDDLTVALHNFPAVITSSSPSSLASVKPANPGYLG